MVLFLQIIWRRAAHGRGPATGHGGVDGAEGAVARADAWMGNRAAAGSNVRRGLQGSAWIALSGAPADAAQGFNQIRVADDREQPAGALLRHYCRGSTATGIRDSFLAARVRGTERNPRAVRG